jgi:hypothetical protein
MFFSILFKNVKILSSLTIIKAIENNFPVHLKKDSSNRISCISSTSKN